MCAHKVSHPRAISLLTSQMAHAWGPGVVQRISTAAGRGGKNSEAKERKRWANFSYHFISEKSRRFLAPQKPCFIWCLIQMKTRWHSLPVHCHKGTIKQIGTWNCNNRSGMASGDWNLMILEVPSNTSDSVIWLYSMKLMHFHAGYPLVKNHLFGNPGQKVEKPVKTKTQ